MAINVRGKNIEVTQALRDYVEKRVKRVTKYFSAIGDISAYLTVEKNKHIVEVTVYANGIILRAEDSGVDMYACIDAVVEKIEKQIDKHKTKLAKRFKGGGHSFHGDLLPAHEEADNSYSDEFKIVKNKRFTVKPMTIEEAIMQMNLLGHDFFVYFDGDEEAINVVYKRKDGQYGLISPELK